LENRLIKDEIHISNLRPYHTITDEEKVEDDEYLVEELLQRRKKGGRTGFLVKWRGYPVMKLPAGSLRQNFPGGAPTLSLISDRRNLIRNEDSGASRRKRNINEPHIICEPEPLATP
jgi:hypothetical protein